MDDCPWSLARLNLTCQDPQVLTIVAMEVQIKVVKTGSVHFMFINRLKAAVAVKSII